MGRDYALPNLIGAKKRGVLESDASGCGAARRIPPTLLPRRQHRYGCRLIGCMQRGRGSKTTDQTERTQT